MEELEEFLPQEIGQGAGEVESQGDDEEEGKIEPEGLVQAEDEGVLHKVGPDEGMDMDEIDAEGQGAGQPDEGDSPSWLQAGEEFQQGHGGAQGEGGEVGEEGTAEKGAEGEMEEQDLKQEGRQDAEPIEGEAPALAIEEAQGEEPGLEHSPGKEGQDPMKAEKTSQNVEIGQPDAAIARMKKTGESPQEGEAGEEGEGEKGNPEEEAEFLLCLALQDKVQKGDGEKELRVCGEIPVFSRGEGKKGAGKVPEGDRARQEEPEEKGAAYAVEEGLEPKAQQVAPPEPGHHPHMARNQRKGIHAAHGGRLKKEGDGVPQGALACVPQDSPLAHGVEEADQEHGEHPQQINPIVSGRIYGNVVSCRGGVGVSYFVYIAEREKTGDGQEKRRAPGGASTLCRGHIG